jgi:hypothetical protein
MAKMGRAEITPGCKHDFVRQIVLQLSLQPLQHIGVFVHRYSFPADAEIAFHVFVGESGEKNHVSAFQVVFELMVCNLLLVKQ